MSVKSPNDETDKFIPVILGWCNYIGRYHLCEATAEPPPLEEWWHPPISPLFSCHSLSLSLQYCVVGPSRLPVYVNYDKEEDGNGTTSNSFASSPYYYFLESLGFSLSALPDRKVQAFLPALTAPLLRRFFVTNLSTPFECSVGGRSPSQPPHPAVPLRFAFTFWPALDPFSSLSSPNRTVSSGHQGKISSFLSLMPRWALRRITPFRDVRGNPPPMPHLLLWTKLRFSRPGIPVSLGLALILRKGGVLQSSFSIRIFSSQPVSLLADLGRSIYILGVINLDFFFLFCLFASWFCWSPG